jgi:hypothetical protein
MGTPMGRDGCPRAPKACTAPTDADSHGVPWLQACRAKDRSIQGSRTPMGSHGYGQAGTRRVPSAHSRTPVRSHECQEAGTRKAPFVRCGHPWALMAARKRREGCIPRGQGLWPWGPSDSGKRREGCILSRVALAHAPSSTWGSGRRVAATHDEGLSPRGPRCMHRREGVPRSTRWATRFAGVGTS